eukprot:11214306-Lingulodinium_polyedra.AAC.1
MEWTGKAGPSLKRLRPSSSSCARPGAGAPSSAPTSWRRTTSCPQRSSASPPQWTTAGSGIGAASSPSGAARRA